MHGETNIKFKSNNITKPVITADPKAPPLETILIHVR
jgi:hypothetical protein